LASQGGPLSMESVTISSVLVTLVTNGIVFIALMISAINTIP
jgi:hypothetical protein